MSNAGIGVMFRCLMGNASAVVALNDAIGKVIKLVVLGDDDKLRIEFEDGTGIVVSDEGQSCCEHRYMRTDDDLTYYSGAVLTGMEIKEAPEIKEDYEVHEVQFLEVQTNRGVFTMASHNEHNGYYGGFVIEIEAY